MIVKQVGHLLCIQQMRVWSLTSNMVPHKLPGVIYEFGARDNSWAFLVWFPQNKQINKQQTLWKWKTHRGKFKWLTLYKVLWVPQVYIDTLYWCPVKLILTGQTNSKAKAMKGRREVFLASVSIHLCFTDGGIELFLDYYVLFLLPF